LDGTLVGVVEVSRRSTALDRGSAGVEKREC